MKRLLSALIILSIMSTFVVGFDFAAVESQALESPTYAQLAAYWAPTIYQDVSATYDVKSDFITSFNYDGDWRGDNNWENLFNYPLYANVYYSVQETLTHYFLGYYFFHPRDDGPINLEKHENDFEGCLIVVKKDTSTYGSFMLLETQSHNHWYQYTNLSSLTTGSDNIDGSVLMDGNHPKVYISANGIGSDAGHGVKAYDGSSANGGDGIVYKYINGTPTVPSNTSGSYTNSYDYGLISMDEFWSRRYDTGGAGHMFSTYGVISGDTYGENACTAPWGWDDPDDGPALLGQNWSDPAHFIDTHLNGLGQFSHTYTYNPYFSHKITIINVTSLSNEDTFNDESDIYAKVTVDGQEHIEQRYWKYNQAEKNSVRPVYWGKNNAEFSNQYSEDYNTIYVAKPHNSQVVIEIKDADGTSGDDSMGTLTTSAAPGSTVTWTNQTTSSGKAKVSAIVYTNPE